MRLEYVGIRVKNLDRSVSFYTRALGLREIRRDDCRSWGGGISVVLKDPRSMQLVELNWYPKNSIFSAPYHRGSELDHLDFSVGAANLSVLERAYRRALRYGGRATKYSPSATGGWAAMVLDPDGVWIRIGRTPRKVRGKPAS